MASEGPAARPTQPVAVPPRAAKAARQGAGPGEASSEPAHVARRLPPGAMYAAAAALVSDPGAIDLATKEFLEGFLAASTRRAEGSKLATLGRLVHVATGDDLFPLSAVKLSKPLAAMKSIGYRSASSYLAAARRRHVALGYAVDEVFRIWLRGAARSLDRGIGPPQRAVVIPVGDLAQLLPGRPEDRAGRPQRAGAALVISCWWMLREAELLELKVSSAVISEDGHVAELRLGVTKADTAGNGARRPLRCTRGVAGLDHRLCPACLVGTVVRERRTAGACPSDPLFADGSGNKCTLAGVVAAWRAFTRDVPRVDDLGAHVNRDVTGHTARRSGAQWLARRGLPLWAVQYLGRWGSSSVRQYTAEAYADRRAVLSRVAAAGGLDDPDARAPEDVELWELAAGGGAEQETVGSPATEKAREVGIVAGAVVDTVRAEAATQTVPAAYRTVTNLRNGVAHAVPAEWSLEMPTAAWKARCGWTWAAGYARMGRGPLTAPACDKCLRAVGATQAGGEDSGGSSG